MLEHPLVSEINRFGYPKDMLIASLENAVSQQECCGIDFYGDEIIEKDAIAIDAGNFEEIILKENLKRYLEENVRFRFFAIKGVKVAMDADKEMVVAEDDLEKYLHEAHGFEFKIAE